MRFLKILAGVVVFLIAVVAGLAFYASRLDWNEIKPLAEKRISEAAGRSFEITGDLEFTFWPRPRVTAGGLRFANAAWGTEPLMLTARHVSFVIAPWSIVTGYPLARSVTVDGVDLLLEANDDGQVNWKLGSGVGGDGDETRVFTELRSMTATDVTVTYKAPGEAPVRFRVDSAKVGARVAGPGVGVDVRGTLNDEAFSVTGNLDPVAGLLSGQRLHGKIDVAAPQLQASLEGKFGELPGLSGSDFRIQAKGPSIPKLTALEKLPADMRGQWQVDLRYAGVRDGFRVTEGDVQLSDYRFQGDVSRDKGKGYGGDVQINAPDYKLHVAGQFGSLDSTRDIDATVSGSGSRLPAVGATAAMADRLRKEWQADFHIKGIADRVEISNLALKIEKSDLSGTLSLERTGPRPRVEGRLSSDFLDVGIFRQAAARPAKQGKAEETDKAGPVLSDEPVPLDWIKAVDGSIELAAQRLETNLLVFQNVQGKATLENGHFTLASEQATIYGARASGSMRIDTSGDTPQVTMQSSAKGADVGKITGDWSDPPFMTGQGDFALDISGTGNSVAALMGSLSGELKVVVGEGTAEVGVLDRMVKTIGLKTIAGLVGEDKGDTVQMNCFAANLSAAAGVAKADVLVLDAKHATIFGSGTINLAKEQYDLVLKPKPKTVAINTAVPVRIGGTFRDPTVSAEKVGTLRKIAGIASLFVFPPAAIAGLADFGAGDNQCVKLAAESK